MDRSANGQDAGFMSDQRDRAAGAEPLPGQPLHQRLQLLRTQLNPFTAPGVSPAEAPLVQAAGAEPEPQSVMHQHLHPDVLSVEHIQTITLLAIVGDPLLIETWTTLSTFALAF